MDNCGIILKHEIVHVPFPISQIMGKGKLIRLANPREPISCLIVMKILNALE